MSSESTTFLEIADDDGADGGARVVRVRGELDLTNASTLEDALSVAHAGPTILDLSGVVFVDSAGIRTIDTAYRRLRDDNRALIVVAPPDSRAGWTFRVAGFSSDFVLESVEAAAVIAARSV